MAIEWTIGNGDQAANVARKLRDYEKKDAEVFAQHHGKKYTIGYVVPKYEDAHFASKIRF
jgi:hypothetical protein